MTNKLLFSLFLLITLFLQIFSINYAYGNGIDSENKKIVYLISPPRSLSVAFLRMMEARGDFYIMHEPSQQAYDLIYYPELTKNWFKENTPRTFQEVKQNIFSKSKKANVFVKEMSFVVHDFLQKDIELVKNKNVYFIFMIRNPHHSVISFYNKVNDVVDGFSDLIGYKACYEIFQDIKKRGANFPIIIYSEDLYTRPSDTVKYLCKHIGIPFKESSLHWSDLGENFSGEPWSEIKHKELARHWHREAMRSTKFTTPSKYQVDTAGYPTFSEIKDVAHRTICKKAYQENLVFYNLLLKEKSRLKQS